MRLLLNMSEIADLGGVEHVRPIIQQHQSGAGRRRTKNPDSSLTARGQAPDKDESSQRLKNVSEGKKTKNMGARKQVSYLK